MLKFFSVIGSLLGYSFVSALGNDSPFFVNKNINLSQFCKKYRCDVDETNQNNHGYFHFQRNLKIKVCKFSNLTQCNLVNDHIMTGSITYDVNDGSDPYNSFDKNVAYAIYINLYQNRRIYWSPNQPAIIEILSDFLVAMNVKSASTIIKKAINLCGRQKCQGLPFKIQFLSGKTGKISYSYEEPDNPGSSVFLWISQNK